MMITIMIGEGEGLFIFTSSFISVLQSLCSLYHWCMLTSGTVPKKHSTVVISETVRETGTANGLAG